MAKFNPDVSQTNIGAMDAGASGIAPIGGNKAIGTALAGAGDVLSGVVELKKQDILSSIDKQVRQGTDKLNQEFGVNDTVLLQGTDVGQSVSPAGLNSAYKNIERLTAGANQGRITQKAYAARLATISRQIRAQYPGFRDEIDAKIASVTGIKPANTIRNELIQESDANARAIAGEQSDFGKFVDRNLDVIPSFMLDWNFSDPLVQKQIKKHVADRKGQAQLVQEENSRMSLKAAQNKNVATDATRSATRRASTLFNDQVNDVTTSVGKDYQELRSSIQQHDSTKPWSPEELQQLDSQFRTIEANLTAQTDQMLDQPIDPNDPSSLTLRTAINDPNQIEQIKQDQLGRLNALRTAIYNKDYGVMAANAAYNEAVKDVDLRRFYESNPVMRNFSVMVDRLGPQVASLIFTSKTGLSAVDATADFLSSDVASRAATGEATSIIDEFGKLKEMGAQPKDYAAVLDKFSGLVSSNEMSDQALVNMISFAYGKNSFGLFSQFKQKDQAALWTKMYNPAITDRVKKLEKTNPGAAELYRQSAEQRFLNYFKTQADSVSTGITSSGANITFDPNTLQLNFQMGRSPDNPSTDNPFARNIFTAADAITSGVEAGNAKTAVEDINQALSTLRPILELRGGDVQGQLLNLFGQMSIDFGAQKQPGFFGRLGKTIWDALGGQEQGDNTDQVPQPQARPTTAIDSATFADASPDQLVNAVMQTESGGNAQAVSDKGAQGAMQTMPETLRDPGYGVRPAQNDSHEEKVRVGRDYLNAMIQRYGSVTVALAAYNAGPGNVNKWISEFGDPSSGEITPEEWRNKIPFKETRDYILKVANNLNS